MKLVALWDVKGMFVYTGCLDLHLSCLCYLIYVIHEFLSYMISPSTYQTANIIYYSLLLIFFFDALCLNYIYLNS